MSDIIAKFLGTPEILFSFIGVIGGIFAAALTIMTTAQLFWKIRTPIPVSHKIALIGLPGSGKTTLITAMFDMVQRGIHIKRARLHGTETINRVNKYIAALNSQQRIGPSKEKDIFVFRFSYVKKKAILARLYDVEIADFPGEYSEKISEEVVSYSTSDGVIKPEPASKIEFEYTLFNKEFFSWIGSSREFLFLVDLSSIYSAVDVRKEVADITARIRTSWQVIEDAISDRGIGSPRRRPVHLVFTKTDSVLVSYLKGVGLMDLLNNKKPPQRNREGVDDNDSNQIKAAIRASGTTSDLVKDLEAPADLMEMLRIENGEIFSDLISFFRNRENSFSVHYTGMKIVDDLRERYGVRDILVACLP
jgi:hypothetical protein